MPPVVLWWVSSWSIKNTYFVGAAAFVAGEFVELEDWLVTGGLLEDLEEGVP